MFAKRLPYFVLAIFLTLAPLRIHCVDIVDDGIAAPEEQEPGDVREPQLDELGSGESDEEETVAEITLNDKIRWVTYSKEFRTVVQEASVSDAENLINKHDLRHSKKKSVVCESGKSLKSPLGMVHLLHKDHSQDRAGAGASARAADLEDEPSDTDTDESAFNSIHAENPVPRELSRVAKSSAFQPADTSQYPAFATGMLKSKNCTAFMIGRMSALTLAECVYDWKEKKWTRNLDLWRGRNCDTYINLMKWESVTIPRLYYTNGDQDYNWAYIKYSEHSSSDNWIGLSYDCMLTNKADVHVTLSGYQKEEMDGGCPYQCPCILLGKKNQIYCPSNFPFAFLGSPLVAAPSIPMKSRLSHNYIGTSPRLYGIASGMVEPSINKVTMITEEAFWLLYDTMDYNNDKPSCDTTYKEWFIKRVVTD